MMEKIDDTPFSDISEDIIDILEVLADFDTRRWRTLTTSLRLNNFSMDEVQWLHKHNVVLCLQRALMDWLELNYNYEKHGKPSWKKLAKAIRTVDGNIFKKIVLEFPGNNIKAS